jgi:radical SAM protein with 4Fe4S-binding SPASM domain
LPIGPFCFVYSAAVRSRYYKVNIEISNICNLQCSFCPEVVRSKKLIDLPLFQRIIDEVTPLTKVVTLHLMGDPLVHPKLAELVEICHAADLEIFFVTNGVLLREKESELLLHPAFRQVSFSLHSFADNFGAKDSSVYLDRIFRFTEAAFEKRPSLYINYRLWNLRNPRGMEETNQDVLRRIEERFAVSIAREWDIRVKKDLPIKNRLSLHFDTEFVWPALDLPVIGLAGTCQGLSSHFGVLVDGTVVPCCLDKEAAIALGNIAQTPLVDILGGSRAQKMLAGFKKGNLVEDLCRRCNYIERFAEPKAVRASSLRQQTSCEKTAQN